MSNNSSTSTSYQVIQDRLPDFVLNKRQLFLREIKALDLFDFLSEYGFSNNTSQDKSQFYIPFISQPLLGDSKQFKSILSDFIFSSNEKYPQMTFNFFIYKSNSKHSKYFIQCCFPSLFNYFSSLEYSSSALTFIRNYSEIEQQYKKSFPDNKIVLTSNSLIQTYILHNFEFRQFFFESFYRAILTSQSLKLENIFLFLIDSFCYSLSYLDQHQLEILKYQINSLGIENSMSLFKKIFKKLIKVWRYSPQFSINEFLEPAPDDPKEYSKSGKLNSLIEFILNYDYKKDKLKIKEKIENFIKESPFTKQRNIKETLKEKNDNIILSDYDTMLFSWIIMQGSNQIPIDGSLMQRNYQRQDEFSSKKSALRLFYFEISIPEPKIKQIKKEKNIRDSAAPLYFIEKQIEACDQIKTSIILQYSDTNFLNDFTTYGKKFCELQLDELQKESCFKAYDNKSYWESNMKLFVFGQLITHLNQEKIKVEAGYCTIDHIKPKNLYVLSKSIFFKSDQQGSLTQDLYYSGFRYLSIMELFNPKYNSILKDDSDFDANDVRIGLSLHRKIYNIILKFSNNQLDLTQCIQQPEVKWADIWKK